MPSLEEMIASKQISQTTGKPTSLREMIASRSSPQGVRSTAARQVGVSPTSGEKALDLAGDFFANYISPISGFESMTDPEAGGLERGLGTLDVALSGTPLLGLGYRAVKGGVKGLIGGGLKLGALKEGAKGATTAVKAALPTAGRQALADMAAGTAGGLAAEGVAQFAPDNAIAQTLAGLAAGGTAGYRVSPKRFKQKQVPAGEETSEILNIMKKHFKTTKRIPKNLDMNVPADFEKALKIMTKRSGEKVGETAEALAEQIPKKGINAEVTKAILDAAKELKMPLKFDKAGNEIVDAAARVLYKPAANKMNALLKQIRESGDDPLKMIEVKKDIGDLAETMKKSKDIGHKAALPMDRAYGKVKELMEGKEIKVPKKILKSFKDANAAFAQNRTIQELVQDAFKKGKEGLPDTIDPGKFKTLYKSLGANDLEKLTSAQRRAFKTLLKDSTGLKAWISNMYQASKSAIKGLAYVAGGIKGKAAADLGSTVVGAPTTRFQKRVRTRYPPASRALKVSGTRLGRKSAEDENQ